MGASESETLTSDAIALIENHERLFEAGDVDADLASFAEDIALVVADSPALEGKEAVRDFGVRRTSSSHL